MKKRNKLCGAVLGILLVLTLSAFQKEENIVAPQFDQIIWSSDSNMFISVGEERIVKRPVPELTPETTISRADHMEKFVAYDEMNDCALAWNQTDRAYRCYSMKNEKAISEIQTDADWYFSDISNNGKVLLSSENEIAAYIFDVASDTDRILLTGYTTAAPIYNVCFSPEGKGVLWHSRNVFQLQNIETGKLSKEINLWDFVDIYALSPDGKKLAVIIMNEQGQNTELIVFDSETGEELGRTRLQDLPARSINFISNEKILAAGKTGLFFIHLSDFSIENGGSFEAETKDIENIYQAILSPNGKYAVLQFIDNSVKLITVK